MSEEEKKAIEELEKFIKEYEPYVFYAKQKGDTAEINPYVKKYETYKTVLNLITKQQKEIEIQKEINIFINHQNLEDKYEEVLEKVITKFLNNNIDNDFISKQVIRDKIKEYRNKKNTIYFGSIIEKKPVQQLIDEKIIEVLSKILGEEEK